MAFGGIFVQKVFEANLNFRFQEKTKVLKTTENHVTKVFFSAALCLPGYVSETGLSSEGGSTDVCLPCPSGYFQEAAGQRGCLKCPFSAISNLNDSRNDDPQTKGLSSILQCRGVEKSMLTDSV